MKKIILSILACTLFAANVSAQSNSSTDNEGSFGLTINPTYYVLGGYSIRGMYHLPKKWSFGLNVEGGFELPDDFRDAFFEDNAAVDVNWDYAVAVETRYRFNKEPFDNGFYAFGTLGFEGWTVIEIDSGEEETFDNWFTSIGVGYNWYPFPKRKLNIGLSYNVIFILNNTDDQNAGSTVFNIDTVIPPSFVPSNIHIGWRF